MGGAAEASRQPAKDASWLAEQDAAPEAAAPEAPAEAPEPPPPSPEDSGGTDENEVAAAGLPAARLRPVAARGAVTAKSAVAGVPEPTPGVPPGTEPASAGREPLLIYTATVTLAVFETKTALDAIEELARKSGGYLVSRADQSVTVRVPTNAFQGTLGGVSKLGDELHRQVNVRDVTEQFADLEIRLKNAEAVRQRLEGLLAKAQKIEDALAVERELERITQTIEQMKGRLRLLAELVAFSTITVNFQAKPRDQVGSEVRLPFPWLGELGLVPLLNLEAK
jgi:hypothetical protein